MRYWIHLALAAALVCMPALAQSNPDNSAENAYVGSIQAVPFTPGVRHLSLNDAIDLGIQHNLALNLARYNQQSAQAQKLQLENYLLPNVTVHGEVGLHQINLEAIGFRPSLITEFGYSPSEAYSFPLVTKVNSQIGEVKLSQALFTWSGWDAWRAGKADERAAYSNKESSLGLVVLDVASSYLRILADSSQVDYARSLLNTDKRLLYQAHEEHLAGTAPNIDELRARVQYQAQQQAVITAENTLAKDKIALNRQIGLDPAQQIQLTDASPYSDLSVMSIEQARAQAFADRQDYQGLKQQIVAATLEARAIKHERYPSLSFSGNYGITGVTGLVYHDTFQAMGTLNIPIFHEAKFRGDADVARAQINELQSEMNDLVDKISQQLRDSLLDIQTTKQLVQVSRSNVDLASTALDQATQRFTAGVDDNLPVAEAQSTLAQAQAQYVNSVYQFNLAKLGFARNLGLLDTQYKNYVPHVDVTSAAHK
ncbi:MAG TPA: TolC family protein [Acidobacteriaceae bacterium]|nr:TolC family protein [Acidobacteriaceae bacterium]